MKKLLSLLLVLTFIFALAGCGGKSEKTSEKDKKEEEKTATVKMNGCEIELLKCIFTDSIYGQDTEYTGSGFPKSEGRVYVDLVLKVKNTGEENFTKDNISAYFMYQDERYDMQFEVEYASLTSIASNDYILPKETAIVHLIEKMDSKITEEDITVKYTVDEKEYEAKVTKEAETDPLNQKAKVKIGDKVNAGGLYSFEVISCEVKEYLMTSDTANSQIYEPFGGDNLQFVDLVLKVKNNTELDLNNITVYTIINNETKGGTSSKETKDNTAIESLSSAPLTAGEEEYCHLYTVIDKTDDTDGLLIRFNLGGICYYCEVEN